MHWMESMTRKRESCRQISKPAEPKDKTARRNGEVEGEGAGSCADAATEGDENVVNV